MSENYFRPNSDLEAAIKACKDPGEIQSLLLHMPVESVINGPAPAPGMPARPLGTTLHARVQAPDGRSVMVSADSYRGLDCLIEGVKRGEITEDIL